jgi:plasmid stabilization system protein ParE
VRRLRIRWSQEALARADAFAARIIESVSRLEGFPDSGRRVPELGEQSPEARELLVSDYRILYRVLDDAVEIVTVFHGRRLLH